MTGMIDIDVWNLFKRTTANKPTFLPKTFSRSNYTSISSLIWTNNLVYSFYIKLLADFRLLYFPLGVRRNFFQNLFVMNN